MSSRPKLRNSSLSMAHFATLQLTTERSEEPKLLPPKVLSLLSFQMDQTIAKGLSFHRIAPQSEKAQKLQASNMPSYRPKSNKHHPKPFGSIEKQEWMIDNVVVPVASSYGLAKEYAYLKSSINNFSTGKELEKLAKEVGFSKAKHYEIGGGLMGNLVATR